MLANSRPATASEPEQLPGDLAIWIFIFAELTVFAIFFLCYSWMHSHNLEIFEAGQENLHPIAGLINTLALISSSYTVALSVIFAKQGRIRLSSFTLVTSILIGLIYVFTKYWEYSQLFDAGYNLSSNNFYMFYFFTTGFHFMHVLLGLIVLGIMAVRLGKITENKLPKDELLNLESAASYWHMIDLLWIILFPLVYVL
ncbi:MAG: cytochrome c oxidase subunit 3 family protein [Oleispira sp.]|nr:cytochrome c oxidase subunit 3 family protein [Oleispira sp.]